MNVIAALCVAVGCFSVFIAGWAWRLDSRSWANRWVGINLTSYGFWAFWSAAALVAPDPGSFGFAYQMIILGSVALHPLGVAVLVSAVDVRGPWAWLAVLVSAAAAAAVLVLSFSGLSLIEGYRQGPWGNVAIPTSDPLRFGHIFASSILASLIGLVVIVWKWNHSASRRLRSAALLFLGLGGCASVLSHFTINVLWLDWGYPDVTALAGVPYLVLYWILISRYRYLSPEPLAVDDALLRSLDEALCLVHPSQRIGEVSPRMARVLGRTAASLRHRTLAEVLDGWSTLQEAWGDAVRGQGRSTSGALGGQEYSLSLEPQFDRFGDLLWVVARLRSTGNLAQRFGQLGLSEREREVGAHLIDGLSGADIARVLGISPATVKNHLHNLFQKTGATNRVELVRVLLGSEEVRP